MDQHKIKNFCEQTWDESIVPSLIEFIKIPNKSPMFDANWVEHGYMETAVAHIKDWCLAQDINGLELEIVRLEGRTPLIYMEIPGQSDETVLLYGHLDKQPEMDGWDDDKGPWKPVIIDGKLYGRGGADDGYAAYASLTAIKALQLQQIPHARCVVLIEACEESGSYDLPYYIDALKDRIREPSLVVCLDSGCGNYDQLWSTTSLRGLIGGDLKAELISEGVHSGNASGIVASSFRVIKQLISRIEDEVSGEIIPAAMQAEIPDERRQQAKDAAEVLGNGVHEAFPLLDGVEPMTDQLDELILNRTWRAMLSITGADGLPPIADAGNVLRPYTSVKLSLRLPPTVNAEQASQHLQKLLTSEIPYNAKVSFTPDEPGQGWNAPSVAPWLAEATEAASQAYFGASAMYMGEGGTIPFMGMLGEKFPDAQFMITGLLGPRSNAHGPNEFLHIDCGKKLTCCVAHVLAEHYRR